MLLLWYLPRLLPPGAAGRPEPMILNLALLCTPAGAARVKAVLESLEEAVGAEGFVLQRGGPFTPYSFAAGVEEGGPGAAPRSSKEEAHDAVLA